MLRAILLQIGATLITAAIAAMMVGARGALSAALGGAACFLPNALFALRLAAASRKPGGSSPAAFFVGEAIKVASAVAILVVVSIGYRDAHWPSLLAGLIVALQANLLALLFRS